MHVCTGTINYIKYIKYIKYIMLSHPLSKLLAGFFNWQLSDPAFLWHIYCLHFWAYFHIAILTIVVFPNKVISLLWDMSAFLMQTCAIVLNTNLATVKLN